MIPKIIHYCWFGGNPLPSLALKCIESWKKCCSEFSIKEWNENNFDINFNTYTKEAHKTKKWAFVSDVARLYAVYTEGGVYLDTDVEIIKPLDNFLNDHMFLGFESDNLLATGLGFGAEKNFYMIKKMIDIYNNISFIKSDGELNTTPCPVYNTDCMKQEGFIINNTKQTMNGITLYPTEYLCPKNWETGEVNFTLNTHTIHHFLASWLSEEEKKRHESNIKFQSVAKRFQRVNQNKDI